MPNEAQLESNQVKIFFCVPHSFVKSIKVNKNSRVKSLMEKHHINCDLIFNGSIICPDLTFQEIGISNGNVIVACKKEQGKMNSSLVQWINLSKDSTFENRLNSLSNKRMKNEYYRIRDIRNMKVEGSTKLYRKLIQKYYSKNSQEIENSIENDYEVNYEPSTMPCTDAMPVKW